jgi:hypothetical protein
VVSVGHFTAPWEETKPYELSDFYKYSAKHRSKGLIQGGHTNQPSDDTSSMGSIRTNRSSASEPPVNSGHHMISAQMPPPLQHARQSSSHRRESNLFNDSFISNTAVSTDFHEEMYDWYEENLNKASVV